ncbi:hypothetical protein BT67DRAFT_411625 [Trichocladium antarcticum]|uniref:Rad60/SUMO-like domain-containing protein n=1 Tax=Trichocladium antarcticum TaxID=1450529 RepID=A0AAN6ZAA0_9PEZI|nr:hypothetical protein BT67DRAFT_411625 [Trichocladium antarcticum]
MATNAQPAESPKKRALPFKRTVVRKQQAVADARNAGDDSDLDLFRHSKEVFSEILRESQEEQALKSHGRKRLKVSVDKSPGRANRKHSLSSCDEILSPHRRSTTSDGSDDDFINDLKGKGKRVVRASPTPNPRAPASAKSTPRSCRPKRATTRTPITRRNTARKPTYSPTTGATIIDSSDDSGDDVIPVDPPTQRKKPAKDLTPRRRVSESDCDNGDDDSPVEIPENPDSEDPTADQPHEPGEFNEWILKAREMQAESQRAIINVAITSQIAGAGPRPICVRRRLNQDVQLLLQVWIAEQIHQNVLVPDDVAAGLFLTWKGNKIYGLSTLASLGARVDAQGRVIQEGEGYVPGGLVLEVWDEETYAEYLETREKEKALVMLEDGEDEDEEDEDEDEEPPVPEAKRGIKIMLKAKDHETMKLMAREDTLVEAMIEAFRVQRGVGPEWDVAIYFDGMRLDYDSMIKDIDIDPDEPNQLEVHLKPRSN